MEEMLHAIIEKKRKDYVINNLNFILKYLWFTEQIEGIETFISKYCTINQEATNSITMEQFDYIINIISKKYNFSNELEALKYLYEKSGYLVHSTRENIYESMRTTGLNGDNKPFDMDELTALDRLLKFKYKQTFSILGWLMIDKQFDKHNCWFYDKTATHAIYYSNGPEWFSQFCGGTYADTPDERRALKYNDKECARNNLIKYCNSIHMEQEDLEYVLSIFEKYWEKYATSKQFMLLIKQNEVEPFVSFDDLVSSFTHDGILDFESLKLRIYFKVFTTDINKCTDTVVPFERITKVDISSLCTTKKIKTSELIEEEKEVKKETIQEYKYYKLVRDILKEFLIQYGTSIGNNIKELNYNDMDIAIRFKSILLKIADNIDNNILINIKDSTTSREGLKECIDNLLESLFIDMDTLTEVLYMAYNYIFNYDSIMTEIKCAEVFGFECKYKDGFKVNNLVKYITSNTRFDVNNCHDTIYSARTQHLIYGKCTIDSEPIAKMIKKYQEDNKLTDEELKILFTELYYLFSKIAKTFEKQELLYFYDEMKEIRRKSLHI